MATTRNVKAQTGSRKTRAGNDLDAFPFDKLSVDGAALAKMIISPLPVPNLRARDPFNERDSTGTTAENSSSDESSPRRGKKQAFKKTEFKSPPKEKPKTSKMEKTQEIMKTPVSNKTKTVGVLQSPDPEANHINKIFRSSAGTPTSDKIGITDSDSFYDVDDSPRANREEYYSDFISESGWESGMSVTLEDDPKTPNSKYTMSPRIARVEETGEVKHSPKQKKKGWGMGFKPARKQSPLGTSPIDPDGADFQNDNESYTGEDIKPTPDSTENIYGTQRMQDSVGSVSSASSSSGNGLDDVSLDIESPPPSVSSEKPVITASAFPSNRLLVCMVVVIALMLIGLVAGLTVFLWERSAIDPICPPDDPCCSDPTLCGVPLDEKDFENLSPPSDEELLKLFKSVAGEAVTSEFTSAGMAANWMLNEDPGKLTKPRSDQGWIQRYLLVYTYYATTLNRSESWISCNPPTEEELNLNVDDTCMYTFPTELPGGSVIYDLVPSKRWLSAADECEWGGVSCGTSVLDEINIDSGDSKSSIPIKSTMRRLAVTSIDLADQHLKGSLVSELTALPELQVLDLSHNGLQGTLSESFSSLQTLRLQYNAIRGRIPENLFSNGSAMRELNVGSNFMTGTIPDEVSLSSTLTDLHLFGNRFSGTIPQFGNTPLVNFQGQQNQFTGIMPFDYGGAWLDTLEEWWVYDNRLSGSISENLGYITNLEDIRVNSNKLTGSIPESIKELQRLFRFDVQNNALTGTIPDSIAELPQLRDVSLQYNNFEGVVPSTLCYLESMEVLEADCLAFVGEPPTDCYCCTTCCNPSIGGCQTY